MRLSVAILVLLFFVACTNTSSTDNPDSSRTKPSLEYLVVPSIPASAIARHTVYIPVYSDIYYSSGNRKVALTATLSVRNTSPVDSMYVSEVEYFDSRGQLLRDYLNEAVLMRPLETIEFIVEDRESQGGAGANFLLKWASKNPNANPIIQCVMIGVSGAQGISFLTEGVEVEDEW